MKNQYKKPIWISDRQPHRNETEMMISITLGLMLCIVVILAAVVFNVVTF